RKSLSPIKMVALGRPFDLGMFYDCRSDTLIPGKTLRFECLIYSGNQIPKPNTEFRIVTSESISDKSSSLGVEASLKASFLCGLVEVEGSAKYLNNNKTSTKQARVTLQYKTTTVFKTLSMNQLGTGNLTHCEVLDKGLATHVVTAILYGAQAFFVFDQESSEEESVQDIQGNLKIMIKKIPLISIEGSGSLKLEDQDREKENKFSCTFHGDFRLEKSPTTFDEAVKVYQDLPRLLGPNKEKAVPVTVYLLPLIALDSKASKLVRQISLRFHELEMWCNDVLNSPAGQNFSQLSKKIKTFKALCSEFKLKLQGTLSQKLPSIRGGGEEEAALAEVLKKAAESPFSGDRLKQWMEEKNKEVNTIKTLMKLMKNTTMVPSENALTDQVCDSENALVIVLTSLDSTEPFLLELDQYLKGTQSDSTDAPEPSRWYSSKDVFDLVKRKAKRFGDFAEANKDKDKKILRFLALGLADKNHEGSAVYLYEDGFRVDDYFELPSKPKPVTVKEDISLKSVGNTGSDIRSHSVPDSCHLTLDPDTANPSLVLLEAVSPSPQRFDSMTQVLCSEGQFGGASYWEVEWRGGGWVDIAVTYRGIGRKGGGKPCLLGRNENSWRLRCTQAGYAAWHDNRKTTVAAPPCPRIGVYLERQKGALSFYSVSDSMMLLHTFRCPFTQPLYPAFRLDLDSTLLICPRETPGS
uniref:B30.2/SPRY domain-containing protein n=1 Tax=Neogobius melanostomus TaxID=47308 RepID=A0A8C6U3U0_9GOBI